MLSSNGRQFPAKPASPRKKTTKSSNNSRILKFARTIPELTGTADVALNHIAEAIQYHKLWR